MIAVLTGDIIDSKKIPQADLENLSQSIKNIFLEIETSTQTKIPFEFWRGDSFQAIIENPKLALWITIAIRAGLKAKSKQISKTNQLCDARIGVGIGDVSYRAKTVSESYGDAFILSGSSLDSMVKNKNKLQIKTPWNEINEELFVSASLTDILISNWTQKQAEAIYTYMLNPQNQQTLAKHFNISQPALQKRINQQGSFTKIELFIKRYEKIISTKIYDDNIN